MLPMEAAALTARQKEILEFLREFAANNGYAPSLREICARFSIKGPQNARKHLDALEKKGFIRRSSGVSRAIELMGATLKDAVTLPIAGHVKAGPPHEAIQDILGHVVLDARFFRCRDAFLLKIDGESMKDAGIQDGDYVIVRPQAVCDNNDIVVAMVNGEATVKRLIRKGGKVILKPENPAMKPIEVDEAQGDFAIVGKVISVIKQIER